MPRPVHFEISADDPERAAEFYEKALGWKIEKWEGPIDYWLIMTGEEGKEGEAGIDGGLLKREPEVPPGTVNTVDVPNLDEYVERAVAAGATVVQPRTVVPGVGYMAYLMDPEQNVFGMMEEDENATE